MKCLNVFLLCLLCIFNNTFVFAKSCCKKCSGKDELDDLKIKIRFFNGNSKVALRTKYENKPLVNTYPDLFATYIGWIDPNGLDSKLSRLAGLVIFKEVEKDVDNNEVVSYSVFLKDSPEYKTTTLEAFTEVEFRKLKLFIQDDNDKNKFILNPDMEAQFQAFLNKENDNWIVFNNYFDGSSIDIESTIVSDLDFCDMPGSVDSKFDKFTKNITDLFKQMVGKGGDKEDVKDDKKEDQKELKSQKVGSKSNILKIDFKNNNNQNENPNENNDNVIEIKKMQGNDEYSENENENVDENKNNKHINIELEMNQSDRQKYFQSDKNKIEKYNNNYQENENYNQNYYENNPNYPNQSGELFSKLIKSEKEKDKNVKNGSKRIGNSTRLNIPIYKQEDMTKYLDKSSSVVLLNSDNKFVKVFKSELRSSSTDVSLSIPKRLLEKKK